MSEQHEFEGKSVEEAIEIGLAQLNLHKDQAVIEVIRKGSRGILGFGGEKALVRISSSENAVGTSPNTGTPATDATSGASAQVEASVPANDVVKSSSNAAVDDAAVDDTVESNQGADVDTGYATDTEAFDESQGGDETDESEKLTSMAVDFLEEIVYLMGYDADVTAVWKDPEPDETEPCLMLSVEGDDLGSLIGRRGETLDSLQYLLRLMINQRVRNWRNIVVDVAGYKAKRSEQIVQLADRMAAQVVESGRAVSLEPMPANERRMVHLALREHPDVYTESSGESDRRKVHIMPKSLLD